MATSKSAKAPTIPTWLLDEQGWALWPIMSWLLEDGRGIDKIDTLVQALAERLQEAGAPLWRLRLSMRTLHPLTVAWTAVWERESEITTPIHTPHGLEQRPSHRGSPLASISRTRRPFRRRLEEGVTSEDHRILHDLAARGATDYFGLPMVFSSGAVAILVFVTDRADGFTAQDLEKFEGLASMLCPVAEVIAAKQVALSVAEAYLGPRTGRRVLQGQITRGDVETIEAAIWFSDIRGWTELNNREPPERTIALANRYFEIVAQAVEAHGGEILKLIGDGVLAIFPTEPGQNDRQACEGAIAAARQALASARTVSDPLPLRFGVGLHFGEVRYGNIGSETRIDFTVLGQAVNIAARIEGLCRRLGHSLLFSATLADRVSTPVRRVASEPLKGCDDAFVICALDAA